MSEQTPATVTVPFEITGWEAKTYEEPEEGPKLSSATVQKRFSGPLEGTSVAILLTAQGDEGNGYVASERVEGTLDGRSGTFVLQHGGIDDRGTPRAFGQIVPGSGTGELRGIRGEAAFAHDESGPRLTLTYTL
ncbi:MAG: hypothetical protein QOD55_1216 [Solirubrobacteraceae bacterium]|jgi:hypothetical protein|nr:hypothetical protein [Solirubrobacteraceae bacterium]